MISRALMALSLLLFSLMPAAAGELPELTGYVIDQANILSQRERNSIAQASREHAKETRTYVVVVTVPSLNGMAIEEYAQAMRSRWAIKRRCQDYYVILLAARNERKMHIEVGRRLRPLLSESEVKHILNTNILPGFTHGRMESAVRNGTQAIYGVLTKENLQSQRRNENSLYFLLGLTVFPLIIFLLAAKHPYYSLSTSDSIVEYDFFDAG